MSLELSPPPQFRSLLVWMWTGALDRDWLLQQVKNSAALGFGGLIVRAGYAMSLPFLSEEWFALVRDVAQESQNCGLQLWLGDEGAGATGTFNPEDGSARSGQGVGRIGREYPQLRRHVLKFASETLARDDIARGALENWKLSPPEGELLYAVAVPSVGRKLDFTHALPLGRSDAEHQSRMIKRMNGDVRVLSFSQQSGDYVDLLSAQTSMEYLDSVHERLREGLGETWDLVHGLWTQAPALRPHPGAKDELPWSPKLPAMFHAQPGYELLEWLPALVADLGDDASRLRQDFWRTISAMEMSAFWAPLQEWAQEHGKEYGGYAPGSEPLNAIVASHGDIVPIYRLWPRVTIEAAGLKCGDHPLDLGRALHARLAASVIALHPHRPVANAPRLTAEAWRDSGWGATLSDRMSSLHHLLRQGANNFSAHGMQVNGRDDMPFLPVPDLQAQPYAAGWSALNAYIARCSWLLSHGQSGARVALLWPIRSAQSHHHPRGHRFTRWVEEDLNATALMLDDLHFEWLFVGEDDIVNGSIENGALFCGASRQRFELVVLPSVTALGRETWARLESFVEQGGKVACLGLLPRYSQSGRDVSFEEEISRSTMVTVDELYNAYARLEDSGDSASAASFAMTRDHESGGRFSSYQPRLNPDVRDALLRVRQLLKESVQPEFETQSSDILYTRRLLNDQETLGIASKTAPQVLATQASASEVPADSVEAREVTPSEPTEATFAWDKPFDWGEDAPEDEADDAPLENDENDEDAPLPMLNDGAMEARVEYRGGDLFWIFNAGERAQNCNVMLRPRREGVPYEIDAWTGELHALPVRMQFPEIEGGGLSLSLEMATQQARLLWIRPHDDNEAQRPHIEAATWTVEDWDGRLARGYATQSGAPRTAVRRGESVQRHIGEPVKVPAPLLLPDSWQANRIGPNALVPAGWQWQRGRHLPGDQRLLFGREQWQPLPPHEANAARDAFERLEVSGIVTLRTQFEIAQLPDELFLPFAALDVPCDLYLNGKFLDEVRPEWSAQTAFEGAQWQWFDLTPFVQTGQNILSCVVDCRERAIETKSNHFVARVPGPPHLLGDFSLTPDGAMTAPQTLVLHGESWHEQGLPFYAGAVDYRQWIKTPNDWQRCRIFLEIARCRDVVGLWLNGRLVGQKLCAPYRFDVTRQIIKGASNEVRLRVWNTAQALFEAHETLPAPSGLLGPVRLVAYPLLAPLIENER